MAENNYLSEYKLFFTEFAATVNPEDQLPVKVAGYCLCESELAGEIVDWILQYLAQKRCPSGLVPHLTKLVVSAIRLDIKKNPISCGYRREDNAFQPLKLMQVVTSKVNDICLSFLDPESISSLPPPTTNPLNSVCAIKNSRRCMEDRHTIIDDFHSVFDVKGGGFATYYGVFDGHAGTDAAVYSVSHLHQFLAESPHYPANPVEALREAFLKTDDFFLEKSNRESLRSGTTALCALVLHDERMLYVGWVGDSQALLVTRGVPNQLVYPHKPDREDERERIKQMGGCVLHWGMWRVNGQLAVSRAIGDLLYKPYVSAEPDIQAIPMTDDQDFLIVACDGLWDFVSEEQAVVTVYETIRKNPGDLEAVSQSLVRQSKTLGSSDNISVIVVFLTDPAKLAALDVWPTIEQKPVTMDTSFEDNPFQNNGQAHTNGTDSSYQKSNLLLDLDGSVDPSATDLYFLNRPANGKEDTTYDDDDFGPETDVDAVDDVLLSPAIAAAKAAALANACNPIGHFADLEASLELQRQQLSAFEPVREPREETPTPPADDVTGGVTLLPEADNVEEGGDESEDEWSYYPVDSTAKQAEPLIQTEKKTEEEDSMESRLNPNAAEFVPSPTSTMPSMEELLISASPCKGGGVVMDHVNIPSPLEFQQEISLRPAGLDNIENPFVSDSLFEAMPEFSNSENEPKYEEIPYQVTEREPVFGDEKLNPFKNSEHLFDQSEASSTKAEFGDETSTSFMTNMSDVESALKPSSGDLNASMVEADFNASDNFNNFSNEVKQTSEDFFGTVYEANTLPISVEFQNEFESEKLLVKNLDYDSGVPFDCHEFDNKPLPPVPADSPLLSPVHISSSRDPLVDFESSPDHKEYDSPLPAKLEECLINGIDELHLQLQATTLEPSSVFNELSFEEDKSPVPQEFGVIEFETSNSNWIPEPNQLIEPLSIPENSQEDFGSLGTTEDLICEVQPIADVHQHVPDVPAISEVLTPVQEILTPTLPEADVKDVELVDTAPVIEEEHAPVAAAAAATVAAAAAATVAAVVSTESTLLNGKADKDGTKTLGKKLVIDKAKSATKSPAGTRTAPVKAPIKSTPTSPTKPLSTLPSAAPRLSSTPKKPTSTTPSRITSKVASTTTASTKAGTTTTSSVTSNVTTRVKVGATSAKPTTLKTTVAAAPTARPRQATTATTKSLIADKKPLSNGDAKLPTKRLDPLATKKFVPSLASKPLSRPASAPVVPKTTKATTISRVGLTSAKHPVKSETNGINKSKPTSIVAARAKTAAAVSKTALVDKQGKETANKQISQTVASKSTVTRTSTATTRRVAGAVTKTSTVTTTSSKSVGPIRRPAAATTTVSKTTTTKIEAPLEENAVVVIQEITSTVTKDDSPIIVDNAHSEVITSTD